MLDQAKALNLNAVIFQVCSHADALYDSEHEPWSSCLVGEQGRGPVIRSARVRHTRSTFRIRVKCQYGHWVTPLNALL